ncbi:MAG: hypothetical protein E6G33_03675 [Actinobacteria bacterium]|nr:MAG: hypothetical protein E6G33_03675 [Actinomycetota bacterium]
MSRYLRVTLLAAMLAALLGSGWSAAAAPTALVPYHEPPLLLPAGRPVTLAYALLPGSARGTLFVRNDLQQRYTRLPLSHGTYCPGDAADAAAMRRDKVCGAALLARVPSALVAGSKLFYYAVLRDPASGRSATVPAGGARRPQRVWIVDRFLAVRLGAHSFGHVSTPNAIVARTGPAGVGLSCCADPPGGDGPSSFDVARNGSVWVLDRLNHRLLVWRAGSSAGPERTVTLPPALSVSDFALGRNGTIYVRAADTADQSRGNKSHLYALTPSGTVWSKAPTTAGIATSQLQLGPDGSLYAAQACGLPCAPFGGHVSWVPLTMPAGRLLSAAERSRGTTPFEPLPGGLRLVTQLSYTRARFALVDGADHVVRAWSVTSKTRMSGLAAAPTLLGGDLVLPLEVSARQHWEKLVVRLAPTGAIRARVALADRPFLGEVNLFAPLRIASDGSLYQLRTSLDAGASVARYSLR